MSAKQSKLRNFLFIGAVPLAAGLGLAAGASAQSGDSVVAREVVQPMASPQVDRLNAALKRLAYDASNVGALVEAGNAALQLGDLDASMGFFGRALDLSPENAQAKIGLAAVSLRSDRPIDALRLFAEAEKAGASVLEVQAERGLAYDLVGNNEEAQRSYRAALASGSGDEVTRRLALSQAIAGDRKGFEASLLPLLQKRDLAAYRTRAFGLAVLGDVDQANAIVDAAMPKDLASRIAPYLAYMPRLTRAQQAAAGNLGIFPRAAEIGRDDPRIAQYSGSSSAGGAATGSRLSPAGTPLGKAESAKATRATTDSRRRRPDRTGSGQQRAAPAPAPALAQATGELPPVSASGGSRLATVAREQVASDEAKAGTPRPAVTKFNLAEVPSTSGSNTQTGGTAPKPDPDSRRSVADAFAGLGKSAQPRTEASSGAVDIASIDVPREAPPEPKAEKKPEPPQHPSRIWVQVATGRDRSALRFDWRRFARKYPELLGKYSPYVVPWGQANRLLAGPLKSDDAARELINALKEGGLDTFSYTSPEGEKIDKLQ